MPPMSGEIAAARVERAEKVPNEADYPTEYQVVTTSAVSGGLMLGNFCTMGLKDGTHTFIAQKLR